VSPAIGKTCDRLTSVFCGVPTKIYSVVVGSFGYGKCWINHFSKISHNNFGKMPIIKRAAAAPEAPQQHNQKSRKGKKAWRKNVDVTEIDAGLEAARDEVIKGYILSK
jgi:hypothetical protein